MLHLLLAFFFLQLSSAATYRYTVDCGGSSCPNAYRLTQTAPSAGTPTNNLPIVCSLGDQVIFSLNAAVANHPFHIKTARGTGDTNAYGFASPNTPVTTASDVTVNCDANLCAVNSGQVFYQCTFHGGMGASITVNNCASTPKAPIPPAPVPPPKPLPDTICTKYAKAKNLSQLALMTAIVDKVVQDEVANPQIAIFFNGTQPPNSTNFLAGGPPLTRLSTNLVTFFGAALGCNDPNFPKYGGNPDMVSVHQKMGIGRTEFDLFNNIFINALAALGVDGPDRTTIRSVLDSFVSQIVNPAIICNKYATALKVNQTTLMTTIVSTIVTNLLNNSQIKPFFDGTLPAGSTNFTQDSTAFGRLANHLVSFFGAALGCNEPGFPAYEGNPNMRVVHENMPIGRTEFDLFNDIFISTLATLGVDAGDQTTIRIILDSFTSQIVNPAIICNKYATALKVSQTALMTTIVTEVVGQELKDSVVKQFFDGTLPVGSTNFTNDKNAYDRLATALVSFFGAALGCNEQGFPAYTGNPDMRVVHAKMPINQDAFNRFNNAFITALQNLKVDLGDQKTIRSILESFSNQIINPTYICKKYATALNVSELDLMNTIVSAVVQAELQEPSLKRYFDGTKPPGSIDFTSDSSQFNRLATNLVTFFGGALGCTDASKKRFPAYTGNPDMKALHAPMNITRADFDLFNTIFINTLDTLGVDTVDQALILATLNSFATAIVASDPMPPPSSGGDPDLTDKGYTLYQRLSDCGIAVYWKPIQSGDTSVSFAVRRRTDGFVALGFPKNDTYMMIGSDAIIGWVSSSGVSVKPYTLNAKFVDDVVENLNLPLTDTSADEINGVTTIYFTRPFAGGNNPITDVEKVTIIASSLDGYDGLRYHSCRVSQATVLNLLTGNSTEGAGQAPNPKKDAHGALMLSGWGVFFVLGLLVAGYGREAFANGLWFKLHQFFQTVGLLLTTTGFIIAWTMVDGVHFNTAFHAQLGTAIMALVYFQYLSGVLRPHHKDGQEKTASRKIFEILHPWTGRILCLLATINIFAGINTWWPFWVNIIYAFIVAIFTVVALVGEFLRQTKQKDGDDQYLQMS